MFVLIGERPIGGGKTVLGFRRVDKTSVGSGAEPVVSISAGVLQRMGQYLLCSTSIFDEVRVVLPFRRTREAGGFSGEEKIPSRSSMPCSSRLFCGIVMPVLLHPG